MLPPHTRILQERLIRLLKGCLTAWETWLREEMSLSRPAQTPPVATQKRDETKNAGG